MLLESNFVREVFTGFHGRSTPHPHLKASAVMMILFNSSTGLSTEAQTHVLLIERSRNGSHHAGQIAFPGGKIERQDRSPLETAQRETEEEIGIAKDQLQLVGSMGFFRTLTSGYDAAVHIAWAIPPLNLAPRQQEVAAILPIPLADLFSQFNARLHLHRRTDLLNLHFHWRDPNSRRDICIWGLTARVMHCFFQMVTAKP